MFVDMENPRKRHENSYRKQQSIKSSEIQFYIVKPIQVLTAGIFNLRLKLQKLKKTKEETGRRRRKRKEN